jgi:UrcA family protein
MKILNTIMTASIAMLATAAGAQMVPTQIEVHYNDLNLGTSAGQATLATRIDVAAKQACGVDANQRMLSLSTAASRCHAQAVSKANLAIASATAPVFASR